MKKVKEIIKNIYTEGPNEDFIKKKDSWTVILLGGILSIPLVRLITKIKIKIHPNVITILTIPFALIAAISFAYGKLVLGAIFFFLNFTLDCTDGKLARLTNTTSQFGEKLDYYTDTVNNLAMYFGLWWSQYYLQGQWLLGGGIVFAHYAIMVFGYTFIKDITYKTIFPRVFSYYSPFEEAFGTFFFAPLFNVVRIAFPILVLLQFISYIILLIKKEKPDLEEIKKRIKNMLKIG